MGEGVYTISVTARLSGVHPQTLRHYDRVGLVVPSRTVGLQRLYSDDDVARLLTLRRLLDAGVNLAGAAIILDLLDQVEKLSR